MDDNFDERASIGSAVDGCSQTRPFARCPVVALVVDDSELMRNLLSEILNHFGIAVETAVDGLEAISKVKMKSYDIIFMDWNMPNLDGLAASRLIRQDFRNDGTPIICVTANSSAAHRQECLAAGMNQLVAKPYAIADIENAIGRWLFQENL